jgi:hypothetical protein
MVQNILHRKEIEITDDTAANNLPSANGDVAPKVSIFWVI